MIALLVAFHFGAAGFFAHSANAQTDLLLVLIHLHDAELVLAANLQLDRSVTLVNSLGDVAQTLDTLSDLNEGTELRGAQNLALDDVADAMLSEERIPDIRLKLLHTERQAAILRLNTENDSLDLFTLLRGPQRGA